MAGFCTVHEPWGLLIGEFQPLTSTDVLNGAGTPHVVLAANQNPPVVALPTGQGPLPVASFPFLHEDSPVLAYHLPTDPRSHHDYDGFPLNLSVDGNSFEVMQSGLIARPPEKRNEQEPALTPGDALDAWIDWQVWAFQELGQLPENVDDFDALTRASCTRRSWKSAREVWFRQGRAEARMALIVRLSREQALHRALDAISHHPRRILQRYRDNTPLNRIQELDSACIRDYARRPGITAEEKAGARQRLLSVRRREQRDTLENRVACWVMESVAELAADYRSASASFPKDAKVVLARSFGQRNLSWRSSEFLFDVLTLPHHPPGPNYPLQFEPRYKTVWKTYLLIRREKWVKDDAWAWQRVLWGETARQLIGCCLHECFRPFAAGTPFYRNESRQGCWTEPPVAPGPFRTDHGNCFLIDSRDLDSASGNSRRRWLQNPPFGRDEFRFIGGTGCDQILFWPKLNRALLIWHYYHVSLSKDPGGLTGLLDRCGKAIELLKAKNHSDLRLSGLVLLADLGRSVSHEPNESKPCVVLEPGPSLRSGARVNALCLPPDVDTWLRFTSDFKQGFRLVIEEMLS